MMKKLFAVLFATVMLSVGVFAVPTTVETVDKAVEFAVDDSAELMGTYGDFSYGISNREVFIFGCSSSAASVTIPSTIEGYPVTSIGNWTFNSCTNLASIEIPDSVTSIGGYAFHKCTSLASIEIPDSVTSIGGSAFSNCTSLASIEIPDSVTSIGGYAFLYCTSLASIEIPDSVTSIDDYTFYRCTSLASIEIPDSVTSIGDYAFRHCTSLESIEIPDSVTSIGYRAFEYCTSLASIEIPDSVTSIGSFAFSSCTSLKDVYYTGSEEQWNNISINNDYLKDANIHFNHVKKSEFKFHTNSSGKFFAKLGHKNLAVGSIKDGGFAIIGEGNVTLSSDEYTINDVVFRSSDTEIFEFVSVNSVGIKDKYSIIINPKNIGTATLTAILPDGTEVSAVIEVEKACSLNLTKAYFPEYLYSNGVFLDGNNGLSTTAEIYVELKNNPLYTYDFSSDNGKNSLHNVKINAIVSGSNLSFEKGTYKNSYSSLMRELKIEETLSDLLLLYPYNVNEDTFKNKQSISVTLTVSADELDTPYTETISFSVKNYSDRVVDEHIRFINDNYAYGVLKNNDAMKYEEAVKNTWEYDWNNAMFNLISIDNLLSFDNPYDIILGDVLSEFLGSSQYHEFGMSLLFEAFYENYEFVLAKVWDECKDLSGFANDLSGVIDTLVLEEYCDFNMELKPNTLDKLFKKSKYTDSNVRNKDDEFFSFISDKIGSKTGKNAINNIFAAADKIGAAWDVLNTGADIINDILDGIDYLTVLNAYFEADEVSKSVVKTVLDMLKLDDSSNSRLKRALETYVLPKTVFDEIAAKIESSVKTRNRIVYDVYDGLFSTQVQSILWTHMACITCSGASLTAATVGGNLLVAWCGGKMISDFLCDGSDKAGEMKKVVILGELAEYAGDALISYEKRLIENPTLENVQNFERALDFFKIIQTQTIYHVQKVNESKAYSFIEMVFTNREHEVVQINLELESTKKYYSDIRCHGWTGGDVASILSPSVSDVKVIQIKCPVNVRLYSPDNELLAEIIDNEVVSVATGVVVSVMDSTKYIIVPAEQDFKVEIDANEAGTMNYSVTEYENGKAVRKVNFDDISLYKGQNFNANLDAGYQVAEDSYALNTKDKNNNDEVIYHSGLYSGSQIHSLSVSVSCEGNGDARGVSAATSGDYVVVVALPDDGEKFLGWYDSDGKFLSRNPDYGFIIKESINLTAKFGDYTPGELNDDGVVDMNDAILLLQHSMFPELFPLEYAGETDFTGDGVVDLNDAILLLQHSMFPDLFPLD